MPWLRTDFRQLKVDVGDKPFAIVDALGFSEALESSDLRVIYARYVLHAAMAWTTICGRRCCNLEIIAVSDMLLIFPPSGVESGKALLGIVQYLCVLLSNAIMLPGGTFPLRAAVSYGPLIAEAHHTMPVKSEPPMPAFPLLIGRPVVEAHQWEQQQKWVGGSIAPESRQYIDNKHPGLLADLVNTGFLAEWDIPTEHGLIPALAVNYVCNPQRGQLQKQQLALAEQEAKDNSVKAKYRAARLFVEGMLQRKCYNPTNPLYTETEPPLTIRPGPKEKADGVSDEKGTAL
jgi:hypothetical protein